MNKYVVSYVNFDDNSVKMKIVEAVSEIEASIKYLINNTGWSDLQDYTDMEDLKNDMFCGDCLINAIQID